MKKLLIVILLIVSLTACEGKVKNIDEGLKIYNDYLQQVEDLIGYPVIEEAEGSNSFQRLSSDDYIDYSREDFEKIYGVERDFSFVLYQYKYILMEFHELISKVVEECSELTSEDTCDLEINDDNVKFMFEVDKNNKIRLEKYQSFTRNYGSNTYTLFNATIIELENIDEKLNVRYYRHNQQKGEEVIISEYYDEYIQDDKSFSIGLKHNEGTYSYLETKNHEQFQFTLSSRDDGRINVGVAIDDNKQGFIGLNADGSIKSGALYLYDQTNNILMFSSNDGNHGINWNMAYVSGWDFLRDNRFEEKKVYKNDQEILEGYSVLFNDSSDVTLTIATNSNNDTEPASFTLTDEEVSLSGYGLSFTEITAAEINTILNDMATNLNQYLLPYGFTDDNQDNFNELESRLVITVDESYIETLFND
ncbi:hypothetical protein KQ51_00193 [Candidatus Izimaplasma bacterium HR1]|jgi:hypothetical protein|uniref:hypothetical protein n=1 Tax=Candidatus Izimoplasma sp. HR1 TaxID=1541959 RepID=UPI0004F8FF7A|nr:hypothetical protein KQ51_00193 [Candidatus Izimaplasma bacterium HR1]